MKHISDQVVESNLFNLSLNNIKKAIAICLLNKKTDGYILKEFILALENAYQLGIPTSLVSGGSSLADPVES